MTAYRCPRCLSVVDVYTPTGTRMVRAVGHDFPTTFTTAERSPMEARCPGSFGPVDDAQRAAREDAGTRRWLGRMDPDQ